MSSLAVPCFSRIWSSRLSVSGVSLVMLAISSSTDGLSRRYALSGHSGSRFTDGREAGSLLTL
jgi:hypothetical protein